MTKVILEQAIELFPYGQGFFDRVHVVGHAKENGSWVPTQWSSQGNPSTPTVSRFSLDQRVLSIKMLHAWGNAVEGENSKTLGSRTIDDFNRGRTVYDAYSEAFFETAADFFDRNPHFIPVLYGLVSSGVGTVGISASIKRGIRYAHALMGNWQEVILPLNNSLFATYSKKQESKCPAKQFGPRIEQQYLIASGHIAKNVPASYTFSNEPFKNPDTLRHSTFIQDRTRDFADNMYTSLLHSL